MAYKLFWHSKPNVLYLEMSGEFDKDAMYKSSHEIRDDFLENSAVLVHILVDTQAVKSYTKDLRVIREATQIYSNHPKLGWMILIGIENPITKFLANATLQIIKKQFKMAKSLEEAMAVLKEVDPLVGAEGEKSKSN
jgi:hypothetical protein